MYVLMMLAMFICKWFKLDDLFEEISKGLRASEDDEGSNAAKGA
jgi:hypothetical protein